MSARASSACETHPKCLPVEACPRLIAAEAGPLRPRDLRSHAADAGAILVRNVYGWFERVKPGVYQLGPVGEAAVTLWLLGGEYRIPDSSIGWG